MAQHNINSYKCHWTDTLGKAHCIQLHCIYHVDFFLCDLRIFIVTGHLAETTSGISLQKPLQTCLT